MTKSQSVRRCRMQHVAYLFCIFLLVFGSLRQQMPSMEVVQAPFGLESGIPRPRRQRDEEQWELNMDPISEHEILVNAPKREITVTNFGWFHPDPQKGFQTMRSMAMKYFNDAILAHERFNASAWHDLDQNPNLERAIIAFLDYDTCQILHWPSFGGRDFN